VAAIQRDVHQLRVGGKGFNAGAQLLAFGASNKAAPVAQLRQPCAKVLKPRFERCTIGIVQRVNVGFQPLMQSAGIGKRAVFQLLFERVELVA